MSAKKFSPHFRASNKIAVSTFPGQRLKEQNAEDGKLLGVDLK